MEELLSFFGRFHPLFVHFPIGILWLAFLFELLTHTKKFKKVRIAIQPTLLFGSLGAICSAASGYWLSLEGGYNEKLLINHQWLGIATAFFSILTYLFHRRTFLLKEKQRKRIRIIIFIPLMILLILTGHLGGSLTHGDNFLKLNTNNDLKLKSSLPISDSSFYKNFISPILEKKCYSCHSSKKQKGQLRLDEVEYILKGGKHGNIIKVFFPDESELYKRLLLPIEDDHHMPPKDKNQLTLDETKLLNYWIKDGASFEKKISEMKKLNLTLTTSLNDNSSQSDFDNSSLPELDNQLIENLKLKGIIILPISKNSKFVRVIFIYPEQVKDNDIELLVPFKLNISEIKLTRTKITNNALKTVSRFEHLRMLDLDYCNISNEGLVFLKKLTNLTRLNLVSTSISDQGISVLKNIPTLRYIYLFKTTVTKKGYAELKSSIPKLIIDTGNYKLNTLKTDTLVFK